MRGKEKMRARPVQKLEEGQWRERWNKGTEQGKKTVPFSVASGLKEENPKQHREILFKMHLSPSCGKTLKDISVKHKHVCFL